MSDSVQPRRRQPTRLPRPWDSPGKNTGVGCHFLLPCMKVKSESEVAQLCPTLRDPMDCSLPGSSVHGIFQARVLEWCAIVFSRFIVAFLFKFYFWSKNSEHDICHLKILSIWYGVINYGHRYVQQISRVHACCITDTLQLMNSSSSFHPAQALATNILLSASMS